jgi:hypothetical protein
MDPWFSIPRLSLLDRGVGFAVAHVRGGGEMGRRWYDEGKLLRKTNTFTDFVACARHLAATGWTSADRLAAEGGSAGGLLMGVVANTDPDAFAAVLASVPFVDPLTSVLDTSLPLTVVEWEEPALPGDPRRDVDQRHPGPLRRAGQVGRPAARDGQRGLRGQRGHPAEDQDVGGPRRRQRPAQHLARPFLRPRLAARPAVRTLRSP